MEVALLALREVLRRYKVKEARTLDAGLLALQCELEERYDLSYFNGLVAAAALSRSKVISSDEVFDRSPT